MQTCNSRPWKSAFDNHDPRGEPLFTLTGDFQVHKENQSFYSLTAS